MVVELDCPQELSAIDRAGELRDRIIRGKARTMAGSRSAQLVVVGCLLLMITALAQGRRLSVGSPYRWSIDGLNIGHNPNFFQDWAHQNSPFQTTDELQFTWVVPDNVLQVNYTSFTACNPFGPIQTWPGDPNGYETNMLFPLRDYKFHTLYFISSDITDCRAGLRLFIDVLG